MPQGMVDCSCQTLLIAVSGVPDVTTVHVLPEWVDTWDGCKALEDELLDGIAWLPTSTCPRICRIVLLEAPMKGPKMFWSNRRGPCADPEATSPYRFREASRTICFFPWAPCRLAIQTDELWRRGELCQIDSNCVNCPLEKDGPTRIQS